jgi:glycosyltransferase involved in cell wall biosynthesis
MISVLILTKNEEANIRKCLASVNWSDDIHVFDSISSDRTTEIAQSLGAVVTSREFTDWSTHQNWAMENLDFKHEWVFHLDADEVCDEQLVQEMKKAAIDKSVRQSAFRMRRKDYFMNRWLKRAQLYPTWLVRFVRPKKVRYERLINPVAVVEGEIGSFQGHILHEPFSHGVRHWFDRHNKYSDLEAIEYLRQDHRKLDLFGVWATDPSRRRRARKSLAYRLPFRPFMAFCYLFVFRLGFLNGMPGYYYSKLRATYEFMIDVKISEMRYLAKLNDDMFVPSLASPVPSDPSNVSSSPQVSGIVEGNHEFK